MRYMILAGNDYTKAASFVDACNAWQEYESNGTHAKVVDTKAYPATDVTDKVCLWHLSWVRTHCDQDMNEASGWLLDAMDRLADQH